MPRPSAVSLAAAHVEVVNAVHHRVQGSGFRVQGSGFRVQGSGFRMHQPLSPSNIRGKYGARSHFLIESGAFYQKGAKQLSFLYLAVWQVVRTAALQRKRWLGITLDTEGPGARIGQSRLDSGLGFHAKGFKTL